MATSRSGEGKGSGFNNTALTTLKMAVFAPIPSPSVRIATNVNPGDLRSWRKANLRSFMSFGAQCLNRIDLSRTLRRDQACEDSDEREEQCHADVNERVERMHREK